MSFISSDPHAWVRPYYEALAGREGFAQLAIPIQFAALVDAIAVDYPAKAAWLREIADLPSQRAMLRSFSNVVYRSPAQRDDEQPARICEARTRRSLALGFHLGIRHQVVPNAREVIRSPIGLHDPLDVAPSGGFYRIRHGLHRGPEWVGAGRGVCRELCCRVRDELG